MFQDPKSMREPIPELNGSLKDRSEVLRWRSFCSANCFNTSSWFTKDEKSTEEVTLGPSRAPGPHHSTSVGPSRHFRRARWPQGPVGGMRSPHEAPTASRMSLRRPRGPRNFVAASLAIDILSRDRFREEIHSHCKLQPYTLSDITSPFVRRRGLPAGGAYWPEGPTVVK